MIHDELGRAWVNGADGPEGVETRSPLDALLAGEAALTSGEEAISIGLEAVRALHVWVCDHGAHPRVIAERLVKASQHYDPAAMLSLSHGDVAAVNGAPEAREVALIRLLLDDPRAGSRTVAGHAQAINAVLGGAYRREGHTWQPGRTAARLESLICEDELAGAEEEQLRQEACRRWLRQMWQVGTLADALKTFYALTRSYWPELILNMSGDDISTFFAQTRAAESERVHRLVNRRVERHCGRHTTLRFQKSTTACGKYAEAAKGNHHRADHAARHAS